LGFAHTAGRRSKQLARKLVAARGLLFAPRAHGTERHVGKPQAHQDGEVRPAAPVVAAQFPPVAPPPRFHQREAEHGADGEAAHGGDQPSRREAEVLTLCVVEEAGDDPRQPEPEEDIDRIAACDVPDCSHEARQRPQTEVNAACHSHLQRRRNFCLGRPCRSPASRAETCPSRPA